MDTVAVCTSRVTYNLSRDSSSFNSFLRGEGAIVMITRSFLRLLLITRDRRMKTVDGEETLLALCRFL